MWNYRTKKSSSSKITKLTCIQTRGEWMGHTTFSTLTSTEWNFSSDQCCSVQKNIPARVGLSSVCVSAARVPISRSPDSSVVCSQLLGWLQRMALMPTPARAHFSDSLCLHDSVQRCLWKIHKWNIFTQVNRSQQRFLMIPSYASGLNMIHMNALTGSANRLWNHIFRAGTIWGHHGNFTQWLSRLPQWSTPNYLHCYGNIQLSLISVIFLFHPWALSFLSKGECISFCTCIVSLVPTYIIFLSDFLWRQLKMVRILAVYELI